MTPFTDTTDPPGTVAAAVERYGFDMLCMGEHPFYPVEMNTPYPGGRAAAQMVRAYRRPVRGAVDGGAGHHHNPPRQHRVPGAGA